MENTHFRENGISNITKGTKNVLQVCFPENLNSSFTKVQNDEQKLRKSNSTDAIDNELNFQASFVPEVK